MQWCITNHKNHKKWHKYNISYVSIHLFFGAFWDIALKSSAWERQDARQYYKKAK